MQGVHRAVALADGDAALVADPQLDGGLALATHGVVVGSSRPRHAGGGPGRRTARAVAPHLHPERLDAEERLLPAEGRPHPQLQGGVGHLELVALVLQPLQSLDQLGDRGAVHVEAQLPGLQLDRRPSRHLRDHEAGAVAHRHRVDVLVGVGPAGQGAGVQPGLVGERRGAHVRLLGVRNPVDHLRHPPGHRRQQLQPLRRQRRHAHLQAQVGNDRNQVAVAGALAVAVDGALHLGGPGPHAGQGVGHPAAGVVVQVHPHRCAEGVHDLGHDGVHLVRQRAPVGVAQHQPLRPGLGHRRQHRQRVVGVVLVAVEGVLGVEEHPPARRH